MKSRPDHSDPDIRGALAALKRAAKSARKLSEATGTPFIVVRDGKIVNLNPTKKRSRKIA